VWGDALTVRSNDHQRNSDAGKDGQKKVSIRAVNSSHDTPPVRIKGKLVAEKRFGGDRENRLGACHEWLKTKQTQVNAWSLSALPPC